MNLNQVKSIIDSLVISGYGEVPFALAFGRDHLAESMTIGTIEAIPYRRGEVEGLWRSPVIVYDEKEVPRTRIIIVK